MSKRLFDITLAILLLPILLPVISLFSVILIIINKQNPFFVQERGITLNKFRMKIIKLRTIGDSLDKNSRKIADKNIFFKPNHKNNISKFGVWLRKTGLDELPQIFNIIKGNMSFVGPRPFMLSDLKLMKKNEWELYKIRESFNSKPGVTGLWQIFCNRDEGVKNLIALEKIYEEMKSTKYDIKILLYTFPVVLTANNVDSVFSSSNFPINHDRLSSNSTEIDVIFEKSTAKIKREDKYSLRLAGNWYASNKYEDKYKNSNLKLIKINSNVKNGN